MPRLRWQIKAFLPVAFALFNGLLLFLLATLSFSVDDRHVILEVAGAGAVAIFAALLIGLAFTVGRPMIDLQQTIARVREGDLDARVQFSNRNDEIGDLGRSFNDMVSNLKQSRQEIQRLHETQMSRAEHLARLGEVAAGVAHEIRNPLAGIAGVIEIVGHDLPENSPAQEVIQELRAEVKHINRILTDMLSAARPKDPEYCLKDLNATAERAVLIAREQARAREIDVVIKKLEDLPLAFYDEGQIGQVLLNLLLNAIQAIERRGNISLETGLHDGCAKLRVADNGKGISPENLPKIFLPFFTTKAEGTGLGLPLARRIIEDHGGRIEVKSEVGKGTEFSVFIPLSGERAEAAAS